MYAQEHLKAKMEAEKAEADDGAEEEADDPTKIGLADAIRMIQLNERGRQGRQRYQFMKLHKMRLQKKEAAAQQGVVDSDPDLAALTIQKILKGMATMRFTKKLRDEELIFIGET